MCSETNLVLGRRPIAVLKDQLCHRSSVGRVEKGGVVEIKRIELSVDGNSFNGFGIDQSVGGVGRSPQAHETADLQRNVAQCLRVSWHIAPGKSFTLAEFLDRDLIAAPSSRSVRLWNRGCQAHLALQPVHRLVQRVLTWSMLCPSRRPNLLQAFLSRLWRTKSTAMTN